MSNQFEFDAQQIDIFREIGNIGAGNAATALASLLNKKIDMTVPDVRMVSFTEVTGIMGGQENIVLGVMVNMSGDLNGFIMLVMGLEEAYSMASILLDREEDPDKTVMVSDLSEMDLSALSEVSNILVGAYLSALSSLTSLTIVPSIPYVTLDMVGAVLSVVAIEYGQVGESVLYLETQFDDSIRGIAGNFFLIPDVESYTVLMKSLGVDI